MWRSLLVKFILLGFAGGFVVILHLQEPRCRGGPQHGETADVTYEAAGTTSHVRSRRVDDPLSRVIESRPSHSEGRVPTILGEPQPWLNLNEATDDQLQQLPGIGPKLASRIVEFRNRHGPIQDFSSLLAIDGIGPKRLEAIQLHLRLSPP